VGGGGTGGGGIYIPPTSATLNIKESTFTKSAPKDISVTLSPGSYSFVSIKNGDYTLTKDKDYTVSGNVYTIKADYLATLPDGKITLVFDVNGGTDPTLVVTVEAGTPPEDDDNGIEINGVKTSLKLNADGSVTITSADLTGFTAPYMLSLPYVSGGNASVGVKKANGTNTTIPFSVYKDGAMVMLINGAGTYGVIENKVSFPDVAGHWAGEYIDFVATRKLYAGNDKGEFSPNGTMTRAMFAQVLANIDGVDLTTYKTSPFSDVPTGTWYTASVEWAADKGIVAGSGNGTFSPNAEIIREQMAVMLNSYAKYKGITLPANQASTAFADESTVSSWAIDAVKDIQKAGIIGGKPGNLFDPKAAATRAEVATVFTKFIESILK
jgi:hypothetical protein